MGPVVLAARTAATGVLIAFLMASCSGGPTPYESNVFGLTGACSPATPGRSLLAMPGQITLGEGEVLSDVRISTDPDYAGEVAVSLVKSREFRAGSVLLYEDSMDFFSLPTTVREPGDWAIALIVEILPGDHGINFTDLKFRIDDTEFISHDIFTLDLLSDGEC